MKLVICDESYLRNHQQEIAEILKDQDKKLEVLYYKNTPPPPNGELIEKIVKDLNNNYKNRIGLRDLNSYQTTDYKRLVNYYETSSYNGPEFYVQNETLANKLEIANKNKGLVSPEPVTNKSGTNNPLPKFNKKKPEKKIPPEQVYEYFSEVFPTAFTKKDVFLMSIALFFTVPSVQPNFVYGATYVEDILKYMKEKGLDLPDGDIENLRIYFAVISAVVNGCINSITLKGVQEFVIKTVEKIRDDEKLGNKIKTVISLLGVIALATGASFPNIQFVMDTLKGASQAEFLSMEVIQGFINASMNVRGFFSAKDFFTQVIGKKDQNAATKIRKKKLKMLNALLPKGRQLAPEDIKILSSGTVYRDKLDLRWRKYISLLAALIPTGVYDGAYLVSAWQAASTLGNNWFAHSSQEDSPVDAGVRLFSVFITVLSFGLKWSFLGKANWLAVQRLFDKLFSDLIIKQNSANEASESKLWNAILVFKEVFFASMGLQSMTGADGLVLSKIFNNKKTYGDFAMAAFIALLGAGGINYKDTVDFFEGGYDAGIDLLKRYKEKLPGLNAHTYGDTPEEFIRRVMYHTALSSDATILKNADVITKVSDEENLLYKNNEYTIYQKTPDGKPIPTHCLNDNFKVFEILIKKLATDGLKAHHYQTFLAKLGRAKNKPNFNYTNLLEKPSSETVTNTSKNINNPFQSLKESKEEVEGYEEEMSDTTTMGSGSSRSSVASLNNIPSEFQPSKEKKSASNFLTLGHIPDASEKQVEQRSVWENITFFASGFSKKIASVVSKPSDDKEAAEPLVNDKEKEPAKDYGSKA